MTDTDMTLLTARSLRDILDYIRAASLNGEWTAVKYHPNGDWSVGSDAINASLRTPVAAPDGLVERVAKALAFADLANYERPLRWPSSPTDVISGRDGTVPFTWDFAETCRKRARTAIAAMPTPDLVEQLIDAMNALLRAPKGVVPDIARPFYDAQIGAFTAVRAREASKGL